jgi:hypothetical protein
MACLIRQQLNLKDSFSVLQQTFPETMHLHLNVCSLLSEVQFVKRQIPTIDECHGETILVALGNNRLLWHRERISDNALKRVAPSGIGFGPIGNWPDINTDSRNSRIEPRCTFGPAAFRLLWRKHYGDVAATFQIQDDWTWIDGSCGNSFAHKGLVERLCRSKLS